MVDWNEENVRHLLTRAGFGAKPNEIKIFLRRGQLLSVETLVGQSPSKAKGPGVSDTDPDSLAALREWWIRRMVKQNNRRLQEKMVLFWHDHFATQYSVVKNVKRMSLQNQTFREHGLDDFKSLVHAVTRDGAMLVMLDGKDNRKSNLNENYARELMELFVLGVVDSNGKANYTQGDVQELTRACTGYQVNAQTDLGFLNPARFDDGSKTMWAVPPNPDNPNNSPVSGVLGFEDANGNLLPPAVNVIDILFAHRDSDDELTMARFLGRKLWEWFGYPEPSKALVDEITTSFRANGFVVRDLLRSIFLHDEFYSETAKTSSVKNPCEFAFGALRALEARTNFDQVHDGLDAMGMELLEPPSVNGWNHGLPWLSTGLFLSRWGAGQQSAAGRTPAEYKLILSKLFDDDGTVDGVVDGLLARLGVADRVPAAARQALIDYMNDTPGSVDLSDETYVETKVRGVLALMLELPEFNVH
jgi:uncharacterized protein (DUF1800 family)